MCVFGVFLQKATITSYRRLVLGFTAISIENCIFLISLQEVYTNGGMLPSKGKWATG
jgi:hypothetical protein